MSTYNVVATTPYSRMVLSSHTSLRAARAAAHQHRIHRRERAARDAAFKHMRIGIQLHEGGLVEGQAYHHGNSSRGSQLVHGVLPGAVYRERGYEERDWHVFHHGRYLGRVSEERGGGEPARYHVRLKKAHRIAKANFPTRSAALRWLNAQRGSR